MRDDSHNFVSSEDAFFHLVVKRLFADPEAIRQLFLRAPAFRHDTAQFVYVQGTPPFGNFSSYCHDIATNVSCQVIFFLFSVNFYVTIYTQKEG